MDKWTMHGPSNRDMGEPWMEQVVKWLCIWVPRAVPLLSLAMHLVLAVFSESRRREDHSWKRLLVWIAYHMTAWATAYVLGNLYLETSLSDLMISAFWVPFLLLHSAHPDNISAYTMEDAELWRRQMLFCSMEIMGSIYIFSRYMMALHTYRILRQVSCIMTFLGIFKRMEGVVAMQRCELGVIRRSFSKQRPTINFSNDNGGGERLAELDDEKALLVAHDLFDICKGAFSDYSVDYMDRDTVRSMFAHGWKNMCKVVEMELSLMYDILYTKTPVVHTWGGYAIRVASPPLTAAALLLFWFCDKEDMEMEMEMEMEDVDVVVTYILFWATLLLDLTWLFRALVSSWTHSFFRIRQNCWFNHKVLCGGGWQKLRYFVVSRYRYICRFSLWLWTSEGAKEAKNYRRWSGTLGQHNLLYQCTGERDTLYSRLGKKIGTEYHSRVDIEIPDYVKKLVFKNISVRCFTAPAGSTDSEQRLSNGMDHETPPAPQVDPLSLARAQPQQPKMLPAMCMAAPSVGGVDRPLRRNKRPRHQSEEQDATVLPVPYEQQADHWRHGQNRIMYDQATLGTDKQAASDEDMMFPPELQEAILVWHIATDVFLRCNPNVVPAAYQDQAKAIKAISDYMVFLVVARPKMLPGLKLCTLYEKTRLVLEEICKVASLGYKHGSSYSTTKEKDQLAMWMLKHKDQLGDPGSAIWEGTQMTNKDRLEGPGITTVWEGTQLAWMLLSLMQDREHYWSETTEEIARTAKRLACWIPDLENPPARGTEGMLEFILDAWVRLLIYASIRCSRESHAKQLSRGGELTTMVWIITEHAKISVVKSNCPSFFL